MCALYFTVLHIILLFLNSSLKSSAQIFTDGKHNFLDCKPFTEWNMDIMGNIRFHSPLFGRKPPLQYPHDFECQWKFRGTAACTPTIYCDRNIQIRNLDNGTCDKEFLKIEDGAGGANYYCGQVASKDVYVKPLKGRDLIATFKVDEDPNFETLTSGFSCTATCHGDLGLAKPLNKDKKSVPDECVCGVFDPHAYWVKHNEKLAEDEANNILPDKRILGGHVNNEEYWKINNRTQHWSTANIINKHTGYPICSGSIVSPQYVLTAASCFKIGHINRNKDDYEVLPQYDKIKNPYTSDYLGQFNYVVRHDQHFNQFSQPIQELIFHPSYSLPSLAHDAALIKLPEPITVDPTEMVCLSTKSFEDTMETMAGKEATMHGIGFQEFKDPENRFFKLANVQILPHANCTEMYKDFGFPNKKICAGALGEVVSGDGCEGDTGNPLLVPLNGGQMVHKQIGIHSFGLGCVQPKYTGTYTPISEIVDWLKSKIDC